MQKHLFLCCLTVILFSTISSGQEFNQLDFKKSIAVKFAPAGLAFGKVTVGGEYNFTPHSSFTVMAGIPFDKSQTVYYNHRDNNLNARTRSVMAGYRYYLGNMPMRGFYVEPFAKYLTHDANGLIYSDLQGQQVVFDTHAHYKGIGAGAQVGVQFMIVKLILVDFFFLGPEANASTFSSVSTDITNNLGWSFADAAEAEQDIKDVLNDIPVVGKKVAVKVDTQKKTVSTDFSGFAPGLRFGASIGIRF